jgi:hypothetical protein
LVTGCRVLQQVDRLAATLDQTIRLTICAALLPLNGIGYAADIQMLRPPSIANASPVTNSDADETR